MKECTSCGEVKSYDEYHRRGKGYKSWCKDCRYDREGEANRLRVARWYVDNPEKAKRTRDKWKAENKERYDALRANWRKDNPKKARAHWTVGNALRYGNMEKEPCERCGDTEVHAHHYDYDKPLDVVWLCDKHHKQVHKEMKHA